MACLKKNEKSATFSPRTDRNTFTRIFFFLNYEPPTPYFFIWETSKEFIHQILEYIRELKLENRHFHRNS